MGKRVRDSMILIPSVKIRVLEFRIPNRLYMPIFCAIPPRCHNPRALATACKCSDGCRSYIETAGALVAKGLRKEWGLEPFRKTLGKRSSRPPRGHGRLGPGRVRLPRVPPVRLRSCADRSCGSLPWRGVGLADQRQAI